jgi:hypothetical protein
MSTCKEFSLEPAPIERHSVNKLARRWLEKKPPNEGLRYGVVGDLPIIILIAWHLLSISFGVLAYQPGWHSNLSEVNERDHAKSAASVTIAGIIGDNSDGEGILP